MRKLISLGEILIILLILLGCSNRDINNRLIKNKFLITQISYIEIEMDIYKKVITSQRELNSLIGFIEDIQILDTRLESIKDLGENNIERIKIFNKTGNIIESISIAEEMIYYKNKWYPIDLKTYDNIRAFYKDNEALEDNILLDIKQRRLTRKEKPITEALEGIWLDENESRVKFDNNHLKQGNQYDYVFEYNIDKINDDNNIHISIYGTKGLFIKGKKLSELHIKMDTTKTHMIMKRIMVGGMIYYDKLIYVDIDGLELGSFDSSFFAESM